MSHVSTDLKNLLVLLENKGFDLKYTKRCIKIIPPNDIKVDMYTVHYGEKAYHPVRRYVKNICKLEIV